MKRERDVLGSDPTFAQKIVHIVENYLPSYEMRSISFYVLKRNFPRYIDLTDNEHTFRKDLNAFLFSTKLLNP